MFLVTNATKAFKLGKQQYLLKINFSNNVKLIIMEIFLNIRRLLGYRFRKMLPKPIN